MIQSTIFSRSNNLVETTLSLLLPTYLRYVSMAQVVQNIIILMINVTSTNLESHI